MAPLIEANDHSTENGYSTTHTYSRDTLYRQVASEKIADPGCIEAVYPCTPEQTRMAKLEFSANQPNNCMHAVLDLAPGIDWDQFRLAWETVYRETPSLRTHILYDQRCSAFQVVLDTDLEIHHVQTQNGHINHPHLPESNSRLALCHFSLITSNHTNQSSFVWSVHESIARPSFLAQVTRRVNQTYLGNSWTENEAVDHDSLDYYEAKAEKYWIQALEGCDPVQYPISSSHEMTNGSSRQISREVELNAPNEPKDRTENLFRAAWSILLGWETGTSDVIFGEAVSQNQWRPSRNQGVSEFPVRVQVPGTKTVSILLSEIRKDAKERAAASYIGVQRVRDLNQDTERACDLRTLLSIETRSHALHMDSSIGYWRREPITAPDLAYNVTVQARQHENGASLIMNFKPSAIEPWQAESLLSRLSFLIQQLDQSDGDELLQDLTMLSEKDCEQLSAWNSFLPPSQNDCIQTAFERSVRATPNASAVDAWDGTLSYRELNLLSNRLALQLVSRGVKRRDIVLLCFEKSMWTTVAMLAVIKAGAAFSTLEPSHPESRLRDITKQTRAVFILSSIKNFELSRSILPEVLAVGPDLMSYENGWHSAAALPSPDASSLMYVAFTSGSTGQAKGVMISHSAFYSAVQYQSSRLGFSHRSRSLDVSTYTFDLWIHSTGATLASGGCLCVPSEEDRKGNLENCINSMAATYTIMTPSVARLISPTAVPSLRVLALIGESPTINDIQRWETRQNMRVMNAYGPTECTTMTVLNDVAKTPQAMTRIGSGAGAVTWVVHPDDHDQLMPVGTVGELVLEGPLLGDGYLNDHEKTSELFITDPVWLVQGTAMRSGRHGRVYKTGDLVRYHQDGSLIYVGRKDNQVKINGQRVELGEVEHHVRVCMPEIEQLAVEVVKPADGAGTSILVIFTSPGSGYDVPRCAPVSTSVQKALTERLPQYMVPTVSIALESLPMTVTDKINRKKLREIGETLSVEQLLVCRDQVEKRMPITKTERTLQALWSEVLHLESKNIGMDDNFLQLGGDSMSAMKLVAAARLKWLHLTVASIFEHPRLSELAENVVRNDSEANIDIEPFSLVGKDVVVESLAGALREYQLEPQQVEDVYPCTPLQEGLLALTSKHAGAYQSRSVLHLAPEVEIGRFQKAWERTVELVPILRTRIVHQPDNGLLQVVVRQQPTWDKWHSLGDYLQDESTMMGLGTPLNRYSITRAKESHCFVWTIHHALYDEASEILVYKVLKALYQGNEPGSIVGYNLFINHLLEQDKDSANSFWQNQFESYQGPNFPTLPLSMQEPTADSKLVRSCTLKHIKTSEITVNSIIRAAWAMVASSRSGSSDVVFGTTVSGRNAPVPGIEAMIGPTIATVPTRIQVQSQVSVGEYLRSIQQQMTALIPYEQTGLQEIAKISPETQEACKFQTLLVVQPPAEQDEKFSVFGRWEEVFDDEAFSSHALTLECLLGHDGKISIAASYDSNIIDTWTMENILNQFSVFMQRLALASPEDNLISVDMIPANDEEKIWNWNGDLPQELNLCLHEMVDKSIQRRPQAVAIHAWDGEMTYGELGRLSTRLSHRLLGQGVSPGEVVVLCFEKSMWTTVAILAVLKAGCTVCMLDPNHPEARRRNIVEQTGARFILSSATYLELSSNLIKRAISVGPELMNETKVPARGFPKTDPSSPMYIVFTSGSTGVPKGVLVHHSAFCSGVHHQAPLQGIKSTSRVLDFTTHAFDVFIYNTGATLAMGGCLCVPSEQDWKDNPTECVRSMDATYLDMTPTVARLIDPSALPLVQAVTLGGEPSTIRDIQRWWSQSRVTNAYGPSECTANTVMNFDAEDPSSATRIGTGAGVATWIVDANDSDRLVPLGVIGELLLEGPLVGRGYLNDSEKTAAAFIDNPAWLQRGAPTANKLGRTRRLYKTGDLVRYHHDGSLIYVARKDTQVKIRGQRVELGEVESHLRSCMPEETELAVEVIIPSGTSAKPTLALFITGKATNGDEIEVTAVPTDVENKLLDRLPTHFVPSVCFVTPRMPMTITDKIDRKELRKIGASDSARQLRSQVAPTIEKRLPSTRMEETLQQLWAKILDVEPGTIGVDDSFFHLGGDSITAMQVSFEARSFQISVSSSDILRHQTIYKLSRHVSFKAGSTSASDAAVTHFDKPFGLTPIQELYLGMQKDVHASFDQCFFLDVSRQYFSVERLRIALETVTQRHPMLRARFFQGQDGRWQQSVAADTQGCIQIHTASPSRTNDVILKARLELDIANGPTMVAVIIEHDTRPKLFIAIHHLVIDLVSWRVLLEEVESLLLFKSLPETPRVSFQYWQKTQAEHSMKSISASAPSNPGELGISPLSDYWGIDPSDVLQGTTFVKGFQLDESVTSALFGSCNDAFRTRPLELLIAALIYSFSQCFKDRESPVMFNESHGRQVFSNDLDLSRTVGWFTSMFPVQLKGQRSTKDLLQAIRATKDCVRAFEDDGWSYFPSQFRDEDAVQNTVSRFPAEVVFNYLGLYQQFERDDAVFKASELPSGCEPPSASLNTRFALFDVEVGVSNGIASVTFTYDTRINHQDRVASWIIYYEKNLNLLSSLLVEADCQWTLADFPLAFKNYNNLDDFENQVLPCLGITRNDIDDIFPCSPLQQGILMSQSKDFSQYRSCTVLEPISATGTVSVGRLEAAWKAVVGKHPILRTLLVDNIPGSSKAFNIILRDPEVGISFFEDTCDVVGAMQFRKRYNPIKAQAQGLPHHLAICQLANGRVFICLEFNHAITDGFSQGLILRDLQAAYAEVTLSNGPSYRNLVQFLDQQDQESARSYWQRYLEGCEPCHFPKLANDSTEYSIETVNVPDVDSNAIRTFCSQFELTPATVLQAAWAVVLGKYTGTTSPCFGYLLSGRDSPIEDAGEIVGPLINMLICRVQLGQDRPVLDMLKTLQGDYVASLPYQTFSVAEAQQTLQLGSSALYNTEISLQHGETRATENTADIYFREHEDLDPTEYDISIKATQTKASLEITLDVRTSRLTRRQGEAVASCLSKAIQEIVARPTASTQDLDILPEEQTDRFWSWNETVPETINQCFHELVKEQARRRPEAVAVHAWNGDLTYGELDSSATQFAVHLVSLDVQVGSIVPICFEKSAWTAVAILAVLKAGASICLLDSSHPESRLKSIVDQTQATLVVTSPLYFGLGSRIAPKAVSLGTEIRHEKNETNVLSTLPTVDSSSVMYIVFSSGSTGSPKGTMIAHSSFCTGIHYQNEALEVKPGTRQYDFSSHGFDMYIYAVGITLANGGCLCVPSDSDRKDNLARTMEEMATTHVMLTPSVSRLIDPEAVPSLKCMAYGGEACTLVDAERWMKHVKLVNAYSPSECTSHAVFNWNATTAQQAIQIGKGQGVVTWVVDPINHNKLVPLGVVGELILEGPLIGNGYLGDPDRTAAAFISEPSWLSKGTPKHPGRSEKARLFKTGDLVQYSDSGNLMYIGRKDTQVKIRGQRVELGEVEYHIRECWVQAAEAQQLAAEVINPTGKVGHAVLVVFLSDDSRREPKTSEEGYPKVFKLPAQIELQLLERLPTYMVPSICFVMSRLPTTTSDKILRKRLQELGASYTVEELANICSEEDDTKRMPRTQTETTLQEVWAQVLNIKQTNIGIDDSFFRLGGDSITAMQVSFEARSRKLAISTGDILRKKTIEKLCESISLTRSVQDGAKGSSEVVLNQPFGLSPIQHLFLGLQADRNACFDQSFFLKIQHQISVSDLQRALSTLLSRHAMLRARFQQKEDGTWIQYITSDTNVHVQTVSDIDTSQYISTARASLNIGNGPLLAVVLINGLHNKQSLFITVHHLAIDLVSWRTLLQELENILLSQPLPSLAPISFQSWQKLQAEFIETQPKGQNSLPFKCQPPLLSYWGLTSNATLKQRTEVTQEFVIGEGITSDILGICNNAYETRPSELMIAALIQSFSTVFSDRHCPPVYNEFHGREVWTEDIDLSRTVGWFTSMYPVQLSESADKTLLEAIRRTKDCSRRFAHNGWSYFVTQFGQPNATTSAQFPTEILFNYHGIYQQLERDDALLKEQPLPQGCTPDSAGDVARFALFDINIGIQNGCMTVAFVYDSTVRHQDKIASWIHEYQSTLSRIPELLKDRAPEWTLTQFPLAFNTDYKHLEEFKSTLLPQLGLQEEDVQDVYPASPLQEGIWISQAKNPSKYRTCSVYQVSCQQGYADVSRLQDAWRAVVQRHSILRTILVDNLPGTSRVMNIVMKNVQPSMSYFKSNESSISISTFREYYDEMERLEIQPLHHFSICQLSTEKLCVSLDINHMLVDGHSQRLIVRDLQSAYAQGLGQTAPLFGGFIDYLEGQSTSESRSFWQNHLSGSEPCLFPRMVASKTIEGDEKCVEAPSINLDAILRLCRDYDITAATVIQAAWALVLSYYTRTERPSFGSLSLGRDIPVPDVDEIVGPLISMLVCQVNLDSKLTVGEMLKAVNHDYVESLPHQFYPLAAIHRDLKLDSSGLFNTAISFQKSQASAGEDVSAITFTSLENDDPTEYDICLHVLQSSSALGIEVVYNTRCLSRDQASDVASIISYAIQAIVSNPESCLGDLDIISEQGLDQIWKWNSVVPTTANTCIHDSISRQAILSPDALAVHAWDGEMTYRELNETSTLLARHLAESGVIKGAIVPLCFEKSLWTTVALLGVIKAGAAFVMLETSYPVSRLEEIVRQAKATTILSSDAFDELGSRLIPRGIQVGHALFSRLREDKRLHQVSLPASDPSSLMYIAFTSGSSGLPKGSMISHSAFSSAVLHQSEKLQFKSTSRVLDASSYAFDLWIHSTGSTLSSGGCLCVPTEAQRQGDLTSCIQSMGATYTIITPSVARFLDPTKVPSLEILALIGESPTIEDIERWRGYAHVMNVYGPTECTTMAIMNASTDFMSVVDRTKIGTGAGAVPWVVNPTDHNQLITMIGVVGELLLEGPILANGYLNDSNLSSSVFIENPPWLLRGSLAHPGRSGRLYKTGDLVQYDQTGTLTYIGRKDTQVKIHGQRVELGEVEYHVRQCMSRAEQVVAEVVKLGGEDLDPVLAVFTSLGGHAAENIGLQPLSEAVGAKENSTVFVAAASMDLEDNLSRRLPSHMVPTVYFVLSQLPKTITDKIDRRALRQLGASYSRQQLADLQSHGRESHGLLPSTDAELVLQKLWAQTLNIKPTTISIKDSFFRLGGDSVAAIKLVSAAREVNVQLTVADIFKHPRLAALANCIAGQSDIASDENISAFSLVGGKDYVLNSLDGTLREYGLDAKLVRDVLPCSPLQEGLLALTTKRPDEYILQSLLQVGPKVDHERFKQAWITVTESMDILRTRIVPHKDHGLLQVVVDEVASWSEEDEPLEEYLQKDRRSEMTLGKQLSRYALVRDPVTCKNWFVWTIHHAMYDGASLALIIDRVGKIYQGQQIESFHGYKHFIKYLFDADIDAGRSFWQSGFSGCQYAQFPALPSSATKAKADSKLEKCYKFQSVATPDITAATIVRAAWAAVTYSRTAIPDVVFGTTVSGRNASIAGIETIVGPTIATVPTRVQIQPTQTISEYLHAIQTWMTDLIPFEQTGLQRIRKMSPEAERACQFQTLLAVQSPENNDGNDEVYLGEWRDHASGQGFASYALVLNCFLDNEGVTIEASYDSRITDARSMNCILDQFTSLIGELSRSSPDQLMESLDMVSVEDKDILWGWNHTLPLKVERCLHDLIADQIRERPNAPAIHAWDGTISYAELDTLANNLALYLLKLGVVPGSIVPLCFEKSVWATVGMLAVWRVGAAICMLEAAHPESRLQGIIEQVSATVMLSSAKHLDLSLRLAPLSVPVGPGLIPSPTDISIDNLPPSDPSSTMYLVFTSGSTGSPKGAFVSHASFCSGVYHQGEKLGFSARSRVLDIASYAFDMPVHLTGVTLAMGGCLCVASEAERKNSLMEAINTTASTIVVMTPSLARLVQPDQVSSVKSIIMGGEPLTVPDAERWWDFARVRNVYGPSECTPLSVINYNAADPTLATRIGKGEGVATWIVDPEDHEKLMPIGVVGELLIEGPLLGDGYLNNPEKTAATYIEDPAWLLRGASSHPGRHGRLYKTGDLARFEEDGTLTCVGRKDTQVKIRGQRVELSEVEHYLAKCMPRASETDQLAAEVIKPSGDGSAPILAVFMSGTSENESADGIDIFPLPEDTEDRLGDYLPSYMIPSVCFIMSRLPTTTTDKIDRKQLRGLGASFSHKELILSQTQGEKRLPSTDMERKLQQLWAEVLHIEPSVIGRDDSFFALGGDSISAMKLVSHARASEVGVTVADIFGHPRLSNLAEHAVQESPNAQADVAPFSLLGGKEEVLSCLSHAFASHGIDTQLIEDIFPCTTLQEGLLALTTKRSSNYVLQSVLTLSDSVDVDRFKAAWKQTVNLCPILRTRVIFDSTHGLVQVVVKDDIDWLEATNVDQYLARDQEVPFGLGQPLARYCLINDRTTGQQSFVWSIHHAAYDGVSMALIQDLMARLYQGLQPTEQTDFKYFIQYLRNQDGEASESFWRAEFADCQSTHFPPIPVSVKEVVADSNLEHFYPLQHNMPNITMATIVRAAWAIVVAGRTGISDVTFGTTVAGRNAPISGIESMVGPTIATIPTRAKVQQDMTVSQYLENTQKQMTDLIPYEQTGLQRIARVSPEAEQACKFQTLLVVQPKDTFTEEFAELGVRRDVTSSESFNSYPLTLECFLEDEGVGIQSTYDSKVLDHALMDRLLGQFGHAMNQLSNSSPGQKLESIQLLTEKDVELLWERNSTVPEAINKSLSELIQNQVDARPDSIAVDAWDGGLTYGELNNKATQLAYSLVEQGVRKDDVVLLCFEKSMWTSVAFFAVLKAGGGICMLDPTHPTSRLQVITQQTKAKIILASDTHVKLSSQLGAEIVIPVGPGSLEPTSTEQTQVLPAPDPSSLMYVVFTSGSTGTPKASLLPNRAFCSNIFYQAPELHFSPRSRVMEITKHGFDVFVFTIGATLSTGGCLCVPKESDWKDNPTECIRRLKATHIEMVPSLARLIKPELVPTLEAVILGGEACSVQDMERWWETQARPINSYGPSECTPHSVMNYDARTPHEASWLGVGSGAVTWVVDPNDHNKLVPPGVAGELLLEGPMLGNGYLDNPEKTAETFIPAPAWLKRGTSKHPGRQSTLYKSGDLVRYQDHNLSYVGRKDTQVKIRGQRVELGEIEYHVREFMSGVDQLVVEAIKPFDSISGAMLAVFLTRETSIVGDIVLEAIESVVEDKLRDHLPSYMVPTICIVLPQMPRGATEKINRKRLLEIGASYSAQQLADVSYKEQGEKRSPTTEMEQKLQLLWSRTLNISTSGIGLDDSFFRLGGDSIGAMKLVAIAREDGLKLSVAAVFQQPTLEALAKAASLLGTDQESLPPQRSQPFALVSDEARHSLTDYLSLNAPHINADNIKDILPTTTFQKYYLRLCLERSELFANYFQLSLGTTVDANQLRETLIVLTDTNSILRTIFVPECSVNEQIVLKKLSPSLEVIHVDGDMDDAAQMVYNNDIKKKHLPGQSFFKCFLLCGSSESRLVVRISHAQYDATGTSRIVEFLMGVSPRTQVGVQSSFSDYISYTHSIQPKAKEYWRNRLENSQATSLKSALRLRVGQPTGLNAQHVYTEASIPIPALPESFTLAMFVSASWAITLSSITGQKDIVYGQVVAGRNASISAIQDIIGPCHNFVPVRARLDPDASAMDLLTAIQEQHVSLGEYDSMALEGIISDCTSWASNAEIDSSVHFLSGGGDGDHDHDHDDDQPSQMKWIEHENFYPTRFEIISFIENGRLVLRLEGDSTYVDQQTINALLNSLKSVATGASEDMNKPVAELELLVDV